ncbi:MAG: ATPase [Acidimicrobiaceae bacterium]|nr:MAG: ATPase [Acidimicrobiaceae bacterium]
MTQRELDGNGSDFVERAFGEGWGEGAGDGSAAGPTRNPWLGGLPGISGVRAGEQSAQWEREIATYVESVIPLGAADTRADLGRLLRTFRYLAANSGQLLNTARAASELGMQAATVRSHVELLEASFLLIRVEAHRPAEHRVLTAHPRIFASDPGLAAWASRAWASSPSAALLGSLTESVVAHDLVAVADAHRDRIVVRHWRDRRNRQEVDLLAVHPDGRLVGIEVKSSTSVGPGDTSGLQAFMAEAGDACVRGIVIYEGDRIVDLTPRGGVRQLLAVPRSAL